MTARFPDGEITWSELRFSDCAAFIRTEFARLPNRDTQQTWLMILRSLLRYLANDIGAIPAGWDTALPRIANRQHARLPRQLTETQVHDLFGACTKDTSRHVRDRALLLAFLRLGLRREEVANLTVRDIELTMYNAGARVSEITALRQRDVTFGSTGYVQLQGKGRKERAIPLWPKTTQILKEWFREMEEPEVAMAFPSVRRAPLTQFAVHLLLRKAVQTASVAGARKH